MSTPDTLFLIRTYLADLSAHEKESIMRELHAHLEDKAASLRAQGHADPDAAAQGAFGDPQAVGAQLADIHSRPTRRQTILAVLPFIMTGLLPVVLFVVAAIDRALGPAGQKLMRIFGFRLNHAETTAVFWLIVLAVIGLLGLGGLRALARGIPSWSVAWVGGLMLDGVVFMGILTDDAAEPVVVLAMLAFLLAFTVALIAISRRRGALIALLISLTGLLQSGIFAAYALSTPPLSRSLLAAVLGMALAVAGIVVIVSVLHRRAGYQAAILLAITLSMVPYTLQLSLTVDAATMVYRMLGNLIIPGVLLLIIPYALGRRDPVTR